jgi:hypothetical protein
VFVSEVVHLNAASVNNTNNQENGRAARYLPGVVGNINFDAGSGYAKKQYIGGAIMDAMDNLPPSPDEDETTDGKDDNKKEEFYELPESPVIRIINAECTSIDSGDIEVQYMAKQLVKLVAGFTASDLEDKDSSLWQYAIDGVKMMRSQEADVHNERSVILQWEQMLKDAASTATGSAMKLLTQRGSRVDKAMIGDIKKRIYSRKKRDLGGAERNVDSLKMHYNWLQRLNNTMIQEKVVPQWLR